MKVFVGGGGGPIGRRGVPLEEGSWLENEVSGF